MTKENAAVAEWVATLERRSNGRTLNQVTFTFPWIDAVDWPTIGYPCDHALGVAMGTALRAMGTHDEDPWVLATLLHLMIYIADYADEGSGPVIYDAAHLIWESIGDGAERASIAPMLRAKLAGIRAMENDMPDKQCATCRYWHSVGEFLEDTRACCQCPVPEWVENILDWEGLERDTSIAGDQGVGCPCWEAGRSQ
jgi:hypothetical protein